MTTQAPVDQTETFADLFNAICDNIETAIRGKREVIHLATVCLIAQGHLLLEDAPGVGKTSLAKALAASVDCSFGRVQFTPDLLPADVVGMTVWNRSTGAFDFRPGPIFSNIILADEINRASPKTQSALLEALGERQVTVDGVTHPLASPFLVIATQNPIEHEGTYPLPESQLDRFLMKITMGYPSRAHELDILERHGTTDPLASIKPVVNAADVIAMSEAAQQVHIAKTLQGYIVDIAVASRRHPGLLLGMSTRAVLALQRVARVQAAADLRTYVTPDDIKALARPVLAHRLLVTPEAQLQGITAAQVLDQILDAIPVPSGPGL
ncbi:MAG TPA: MoxR family ATPase [Acidimicrobiales bacterium]